jgi:plastocyanin
MFHKIFFCLAISIAIAGTDAGAATVDVFVTNSGGMPAANAVVSLMPDTGTTQAIPHTPEKSIIDQRHETFLPLVVVVRKGGEVIFTNNDVTMHQVYSFSPVKQFQFEIDKGHVSRPVVFEKSGVAAIGCNIHDNMVAYVYVADAPFAMITDAGGHVEIPDVPDGRYLVGVWHPQLRIGRQPAPTVLTVNGERAKLTVSVPLMAAPAMKMHKTDY